MEKPAEKQHTTTNSNRSEAIQLSFAVKLLRAHASYKSNCGRPACKGTSYTPVLMIPLPHGILILNSMEKARTIEINTPRWECFTISFALTSHLLYTFAASITKMSNAQEVTWNHNVKFYGFTPVVRDPDVLFKDHPTATGPNPKQLPYTVNDFPLPTSPVVTAVKEFVKVCFGLSVAKLELG